jgi:hypothetical protein
VKYLATYNIMWVKTEIEADTEEDAREVIENHVYVEMEKGEGMEFNDHGEIQDIDIEER